MFSTQQLLITFHVLTLLVLSVAIVYTCAHVWGWGYYMYTHTCTRKHINRSRVLKKGSIITFTIGGQSH